MSAPGAAPRALCDSLLAKIEEQFDRTAHLIGRLPPSVAEDAAGLLGHLLDCAAGFCAALAAVAPERRAHFARFRDLPVNHRCAPEEAIARLAEYRQHIVAGFAALDDVVLSRRVPTVFVPGGETVLTLLLGNLEHLINHKHQLFTMLKQAGAPVGTPDLYVLRGEYPRR